MEEYPDKPVSVTQLAEEITPLALPEFQGVARLARRRNTDGTVTASNPYILIKCGLLTAAQKQLLTAVIDAHTPLLESAPVDWKGTYATATTPEERTAVIAQRFGLL